MPYDAVIFDARNHIFGIIGPLGIFAISTLIFFAVRVVRVPESYTRGGDPSVNRAMAALLILVLLAALIASILPFGLAMGARVAMSTHRVTVFQGCVEAYDRIVHTDDHGVADTYFTVDGKNFHFNSSPWLPGFHNENDVIRSGERLRMTMGGKTVLVIEHVKPDCSAKS